MMISLHFYFDRMPLYRPDLVAQTSVHRSLGPFFEHDLSQKTIDMSSDGRVMTTIGPTQNDLDCGVRIFRPEYSSLGEAAIFNLNP